MRDKIILTRPNPSGKEFGQELCANIPSLSQGQLIYAPMLEIEAQGFEMLNHEYGGAIITSSNALKYIPDRLRALPLYCVGSQSAENAKDMGFGNVCGESKNVSDLMDVMINDHKETPSRFCYFRGRDVSYDVKRFLINHDHNVDEYICYSAIESKELCSSVLKKIKNDNVRAVTFFSKRTAMVFLSLAREYKVIADLKNIQALCISEGVSNVLDDVFEKNIVANRPDAKGMMDAVRAACTIT